MNDRTSRIRPSTATLLLIAAASLAACDDATPTGPQPLYDGAAALLEPGAAGASAMTATRGARDVRPPDHRPAQFGGLATLVRVSGTTPEQIARIEVTRSNRGTTVDLIEGRTAFDPSGDLVRFGDVLAALESDVRLNIQGSGPRQDDGSIAAAYAKVKILDGDDGSDQGSAAGWASLESLTGTPPNQVMGVVLANPRHDHRIGVAILERSTAFDPSGDVQTFAGLLEAFRADVRVWISARGERNDGGVLVAATVAVELTTGGERDRDHDRERDHQRDTRRDRDGARDSR